MWNRLGVFASTSLDLQVSGAGFEPSKKMKLVPPDFGCLAGRMGDTAIIGAGVYASDLAAIACTGQSPDSAL